MSAADESITDEGNCINAELDQYLFQPVISRQDDLASWWKHAQASSLVDTGTKVPGTTICQDALQYSW